MADVVPFVSAHEWINALPTDAARETLTRCCGSQRWVAAMLAQRPFESSQALQNAARTIWSTLGRDDYLEAFSCHPPIGGHLSELRAKFASTLAWSSEEQSGAARGDDETLLELQAANRAYRERFGFIFIICATGKTADHMLNALRTRLTHDPTVELLQAAAEQAKITELRLEKVGR